MPISSLITVTALGLGVFGWPAAAYGIRPVLEREGSRIKTFGTVGCFTDQLELAGAKLPTTTCFLDQKGYVSLSLRSDNPKHLDFEAVTQLLEKAAARRK